MDQRRNFNIAAFGTTFEPGNIRLEDAKRRRGIWTKTNYDEKLLLVRYGNTGYKDPVTGKWVTSEALLKSGGKEWNDIRHCYTYEEVKMLDGTPVMHLRYNDKNKWKIMVHEEMVFEAIKECHTAVQHNKLKSTRDKVKERYYNISEDLCKVFIKTCPRCTPEDGNLVTTNPSGFRERFTGCVVDYSTNPRLDVSGVTTMKYILALRDDETGFTVLRPICCNKDASLLAYELSLMFGILGGPKKVFQCAEGTELNSRLVKDLVQEMEPNCNHMNGEVDSMSERIKSVITRLEGEIHIHDDDDDDDDGGGGGDKIRKSDWVRLVPKAMAEINEFAYRKVYGMEFSTAPVVNQPIPVLPVCETHLNIEKECPPAVAKLFSGEDDDVEEKEVITLMTRSDDKGEGVPSNDAPERIEPSMIWGNLLQDKGEFASRTGGNAIDVDNGRGNEMIYPRLECGLCNKKTVFGQGLLTVAVQQSYYDDFAKGTRWWDASMLATFGILKAHEQHDKNTIFVDSGTPTKTDKQKKPDTLVLPKSVKCILTVAMRARHFVVIQLKLEHCTTVVYDGRSQDAEDLHQWENHVDYIMTRYGISKEKSKMTWLLRHHTYKDFGSRRILHIKQKDDHNCGPIACRVLWELLAPGEMDAKYGKVPEGSTRAPKAGDKVEEWRVICISELREMLRVHSKEWSIRKRKSN